MLIVVAVSYNKCMYSNCMYMVLLYKQKLENNLTSQGVQQMVQNRLPRDVERCREPAPFFCSVSMGWGRCLAPQKELGSGLNRDLKAIKFILRMCCQRSNKFICSFRQCMHEVLLYQVFCFVFFPFPRGRRGCGSS